MADKEFLLQFIKIQLKEPPNTANKETENHKNCINSYNLLKLVPSRDKI